MFGAVCGLAAVAGSLGCVAPGTCVPPKAENVRAWPMKPRQQWGDSGGFCGSLSVQSGALMYGNWISQIQVRQATNHGEGHGNPEKGYEILPTNIEQSMTNLGLRFDSFDYNQTKPQAPVYKQFLKKHLVAMHPVVWFVMCRGDGQQIPYPGSNPNGGRFSHIEPLWGYFSNHSITDDVVRDDDVIVHGSDWDQFGYYRAMSTLVDSPAMEGNCKHAGDHPGVNEMYPCIYNEVDYGYAILGNIDPLNKTVPAILEVDSWNEPDVNEPLVRPKELHGALTISGLVAGQKYTIYRYNGKHNVPRDSNFNRNYEHMHSITATAVSQKWVDPNSFLSNTATYYRVVKA